jgi:SH3-like domain-containing protein
MQPIHRIVRVKLARTIQYSDPLSVAAGEKVMVGREDNEFPGWRWCKASNGHEGWIPIELLSDQGAEAMVLSDYSARELAVQSGEEVAIEDRRHDWLLVRNAQGECGWIPASHTEPLETP